MIESRPEPLNGETQDKLRRFFGGELFAVLVKLADAQAKFQQVKALNDGVTAAQGSPLKLDAANRELEVAARYQTFIEVLTEFKEQKSPYVTAKLY